MHQAASNSACVAAGRKSKLQPHCLTTTEMINNLTGRMAAAMRNAVLLSLTLLLTSSNSFLRSARSLHPSYQSYVCTCLQTEGTKTVESSRVLRIHDTSLTSFRGNKFVSPVMEDRLKRGLLTSADLDR